MSAPSDTGFDLRDLFFESAAELLQALNDQGLELEKKPADTELLRCLRRTVHTLKGDSAACGYKELSAVAHELEDLLSPETLAGHSRAVAELVLLAADLFEDMLAAYRDGAELPDTAAFRRKLEGVTGSRKQVSQVPSRLSGRFEWTEYQQMAIADAQRRGLQVFNAALAIHADCTFAVAAVEMVKSVCGDCGELLAVVPEGKIPARLDVIELALATSHDTAYLTKRLRIPATISDVLLESISPVSQDRTAANAAVSTSHDDSPFGAEWMEHFETGSVPEPVHRTNPVSSEPAHEWDHEPELRQEHPLASDPHEFHMPAFFEDAPSEPGTPTLSEHSFYEEVHSGPDTQVHTPTGFTENKLRVDAERVDDVMNLVGELIIAKSMLTQAAGEFERRFPKDALRSKFSDALAFQARVLNDLQKSVMKIRMVPVEQLFRRFPRVVRDVARECGKEVNLELSGQDTDVDKSVLDILAEPLGHIIRNAVDHGIESPEDRAINGKPATGTLRLSASHQGNVIVIEISDDGRGIDHEKVLAKAIRLGLVTEKQAAHMAPHEAMDLIFEPGFSTASQITALSGRGVGMDVVKSVLQRVKGSIRIDSQPGKGTLFLLRVPLTLAIIKALLFRAAGKTYAIPLGTVLEITRAQQSDVHRVEDREVIQVRDQILTLVRIERLSRSNASSSKKFFVVTISVNDRRFGLVVDSLVGEEELVIKAMDDRLVATDLVSGASILGDGTVVLILNTLSLVSRLAKTTAVGISA